MASPIPTHHEDLNAAKLTDLQLRVANLEFNDAQRPVASKPGTSSVLPDAVKIERNLLCAFGGVCILLCGFLYVKSHNSE
jgi:hypothetical protein